MNKNQETQNPQDIQVPRNPYTPNPSYTKQSRENPISEAKTYVEIQNKECRSCHVIKPSTEFYYFKASADRLTSYCKECQKKKQKAYYDKNKDTIKSNYYTEEFIAKRRTKPKQKYNPRRDHLKQKVKEKRLPKRKIDLVIMAFRESNFGKPGEIVCCKCKHPVKDQSNPRGKTNDFIQLDHFYPLEDKDGNLNALTVGNVSLLCASCNHLKGNKDPIEFFSKEDFEDILSIQQELRLKEIRLDAQEALDD